MSDELDTAAKVGGLTGGGLTVAGAVWYLIRRAINKGDHASDKLEADRDARLVHCEKALENHRDQLEAMKRELVEHDTRLAFREGRYGAEPLTIPGVKPSAALEAYRAEQIAKAKEP